MNEAKTGAGKIILTVVVAGLWVGLCEFVRNQLVLVSKWQNYYRGMGLEFPSKPVNGMMWMVWSFLMSGTTFAISRRFNLPQTTLIAWVMGYVMMWVVIGNLSVLPVSILPIAVPFSFVEALGAAFICRKLARPNQP
ncbi:MAG TPA: hypothetical protein VMH22_11045 [bacterium]|nr:hypothetical protein [bacterium]